MKNQYFGDVNDYRKYGLLRILTGRGEMSTAVCWMLTPDDGRPDGGFIGYLGEADAWRCYDPDLFDRLREWGILKEVWDVTLADEIGLLPGACFYTQTLNDDLNSRARYFDSFWNVAEGCDLIFFDPDNGLEVKSKPIGRKGSSKYLGWYELVRAYSSACSVLVYQHFPREKRDTFIEWMAKEMQHRTGAARVYSFRTAHVVFFLLPSERHIATFEKNVEGVSETWRDQIRVRRF
jgi:hypothetical protein